VFPDLTEQGRSFRLAQAMAVGVIHLRLARFAIDGK
jgi:hypothetical protein